MCHSRELRAHITRVVPLKKKKRTLQQRYKVFDAVRKAKREQRRFFCLFFLFLQKPQRCTLARPANKGREAKAEDRGAACLGFTTRREAHIGRFPWRPSLH